jgi:hypothetical protein
VSEDDRELIADSSWLIADREKNRGRRSEGRDQRTATAGKAEERKTEEQQNGHQFAAG